MSTIKHTALFGILMLTIFWAQNLFGGGNSIQTAFKSVSIGDRDSISQKKFIAKELDLRQPAVSEYVLNAMNSKVVNIAVVNSMAVINYSFPERGLRWLLDNYDNFSAVARVNMVISLKFVDKVESYRLINILLADERSVKYGGRAPMLRPHDERVCDYARNQIAFIMARSGTLPKEIKRLMSSSSLVYHRDSAIHNLRLWWKENGSDFLAKKERVSAVGSDIDRKITELEEIGEKYKCDCGSCKETEQYMQSDESTRNPAHNPALTFSQRMALISKSPNQQTNEVLVKTKPDEELSNKKISVVMIAGIIIVMLFVGVIGVRYIRKIGVCLIVFILALTAISVYADVPATGYYVVKTSAIKQFIPVGGSVDRVTIKDISHIAIVQGHFEGRCSLYLKTEHFQFRIEMSEDSIGTGGGRKIFLHPAKGTHRFSLSMFSQEKKQHIFNCKGNFNLSKSLSTSKNWMNNEYTVLFQQLNLKK